MNEVCEMPECKVVDLATPEQVFALQDLPFRGADLMGPYLAGIGLIPSPKAFVMLGEVKAADILANLKAWMGKARAWRDEQDRLKAEALALELERKKKRQRIRQLEEDFGYGIFDDFTSDKSKRPKQFVFVTGFFSEDYAEQFDAIQGEREKSFGTSYKGLFLYGPKRKNKSSSAWLAAKEYMHVYGQSAKFVDTTELATLASQKHQGEAFCQKFNDLLDECLEVDLLVLDDLGTENIEGKSKSKAYEAAIYQIIEKRTRSYGQWTIITCNFNPQDLCKHSFSEANQEKIEGRITDYFLPVDFDVAG